MRHFLALAFSCVLLFCIHATPLNAADYGGNSAIYDSLVSTVKELDINSAQSVKVEDFMMQRDAATLQLTGTITFCQPVFGKVCVAVFRGKGHIIMTPPTIIEKEQLERQMGAQELDKEFDKMCMLFFDNTLQQCLEGRQTTECQDPKAAREAWSFAKNIIFYDDSKFYDSGFALNVLNNANSSAFTIIYQDKSFSTGRFVIDPMLDEPVCFYKCNSGFSAKYQILVSQFFEAEAYAKDPDYARDNNALSIRAYNMDVEINQKLHFSAKTKTTCQANYNGIQWVRFDLASNLEVEKVLEGQTELPFFQNDDYVWIQFVKATNKGETREIELKYSGDIFLQQLQFVFMKVPSTDWYPKVPGVHTSTFDMTFHISTTYQFQSAGTLVSTKESNGMMTSRYVISKPFIHTSFSIGVYQKLEYKDSSRFKVTVWSERESQQQQAVAFDIRHSLEYYSKLFGPPPTDTITATEIFAFHGQAFPGFLHLSYGAFMSGDNSGRYESFVAHEVAHQWWGGSLSWKSYHDQWMSEAFAEYSSLMYMQAIQHNNRHFFECLEKSRTNLISLRKSFIGNGIEAAPIWLGARTNTSRANIGDYQRLIYDKGAWVLHMLRNMMMDMDTFSDSAFVAMMSDFYMSHRMTSPTTADFQKTVEKHVGQDMTWFFRQWIYGNKVPSYTFAYRSEKQANGQYKMRVRVKQSKVPAEFSMVMPIKLDFGSEGTSIVRAVLTGEQFEFDLPLLPFEPKKIEFNPYSSVLCEFEVEKW